VETVVKKFHRFVETHRLIRDGNILLAVSGGSDSVAMAHIFAEYKKLYRKRITLFVCHIHHHIRPDADYDSEVAKETAKLIRAPFVIRHLKNPKRPTEAWARNARYNALFETALRLGCSTVATAHTADDQAETVIIRILRGTGLDGLSGILVKSAPVEGTTLVRPLLCFRKSELSEYTTKNNLPVAVDSTNFDLTILRNKIRHRLIPLLETEYRRGSVEALSRLALAAQTSQTEEVEPKCRFFFGHTECLIPKESLQEHPYGVYKAIRKALSILCGKQISLPLQDAVLRILNGILEDAHISTSLTKDVIAETLPEGVVLYRNKEEPPDEPHTFSVPGKICLWGIEFVSETFPSNGFELKEHKQHKSPFIEVFDADKAGRRITIRYLKEGDRFEPFGIDGETKVFRFLIKSGFPRRLRKFVPILLSSDDKPLWVVPFRIDRRFAIGPDTKNILRVEVRCSDVWYI